MVSTCGTRRHPESPQKKLETLDEQTFSTLEISHLAWLSHIRFGDLKLPCQMPLLDMASLWLIRRG